MFDWFGRLMVKVAPIRTVERRKLRGFGRVGGSGGSCVGQ